MLDDVLLASTLTEGLLYGIEMFNLAGEGSGLRNRGPSFHPAIIAIKRRKSSIHQNTHFLS
jgi:hypothetical protein